MHGAKTIKNNRYFLCHGIVNRLPIGRPRNRGSIAGISARNFCLLQNVRIGSGALVYPILKAEGMLSPWAKRSEHEADILPKLVAIPLPPPLPHVTNFTSRKT